MIPSCNEVPQTYLLILTNACMINILLVFRWSNAGNTILTLNILSEKSDIGQNYDFQMLYISLLYVLFMSPLNV